MLTDSWLFMTCSWRLRRRRQHPQHQSSSSSSSSSSSQSPSQSPSHGQQTQQMDTNGNKGGQWQQLVSAVQVEHGNWILYQVLHLSKRAVVRPTAPIANAGFVQIPPLSYTSLQTCSTVILTESHIIQALSASYTWWLTMFKVSHLHVHTLISSL